MFLYNLTLQLPSAITQAIYGNFSGPKHQEILVGRGNILELLRADATGKLQSITCTHVFGVVRSLAAFRLTGDNRDYIIVGSDSGKITILEFDQAKAQFSRIHEEPFGRSGCRRIVPGQLLATDPNGRAVLIGALEKQKFVYILNRNAQSRLTISSPLEAHKSHTICWHVVGVDVGFDSPIFACIELDYADEDDEDDDDDDDDDDSTQKVLTYYELDLGLNHVVRKWSDPIDPSAHYLISVPGGDSGPGGVLVCAENYIYWKNEGQEEVSVPIPRRDGTPTNQGLIMVCSATHKRKHMFFFLVQSEFGDLYKVMLDYQDDVVKQINIKYFDTIPVATSICVTKRGFLFASCETGNHVLYAFLGIGDDDDGSEVRADDTYVYFEPRQLRNLRLAESIESTNPTTDVVIHDMKGEGTPQIYAACGSGSSASLRVLRHGLEVDEEGALDLPGNPTAVWTVRGTIDDVYDKYIVVSFLNATLVLAIGDTVEETDASGLQLKSPTLNVFQIGTDQILQVTPTGWRSVRSDERVHEWRVPGKKTITHSACNNRQLVVALTGGEITYFEVQEDGQLAEVAKTDVGHDVACLDIAPISEGRRRSRYVAVGDWENTVRVLSLDFDNCLHGVAVQQLPTTPTSICLIEMKHENAVHGTLFLNIGLTDGVLQRTVLDPVTGDLTDTRRRYLGDRPVKLLKIMVQKSPAMLALSSRSWLSYSHHQRFHLVPLSYVPLEFASGFNSEQCPEGIVAVSGDTLRIALIERLGETFNQKEVPLRYTPRKVVREPQYNNLLTLESDHGIASQVEEEEKRSKALLQQRQAAQAAAAASGEDDDDDDDEVGDWYREQRIQPLRVGNGKWASCVRLYSPHSNTTLDVVELPEDEAALSICAVQFAAKRDKMFVVVGTAKGLHLAPRKHSGCYLHVYTLEDAGKRLQLFHSTEVEDLPAALCPFQGRILAGVGKMLRIYDLGKKKLLRKCENRFLPTMVKTIHTQGNRIIVGDISESFHYIHYKRFENMMYVFADDTVPRWVTASCMMDYDTVAGGDKFGNMWICRLPTELSDEIEQDTTGAYLRINRPQLNGAPHKIRTAINFYVNEPVTSVTKTALIPGGADVLLYTTISGRIGVLIPFISREDVDFFAHLEMHMREKNPPLCGRDHLAYRSYYFPVKDVIDGDLCEQYSALPDAVQETIASELDRKRGEVMKKLEDIRNRCL